MNNLPITFWKQLAARFFADNPKFFDVWTKYNIYFIAIVAFLPWVVKEMLPGMGIEVPQWLTYTNGVFTSVLTLLVGFGIGNVTTAQATVNTPDTPALLVKEELPKAADLSATVAQLLQVQAQQRAEIEELKAKQPKTGL